MTFRVRHHNDNNFGNLTILVDDITGCWFVCKEICKALKQKISTANAKLIVSSNNYMEIRYFSGIKDEELFSCLWKNKKDHTSKLLINKFGVLQIIHSIKSNNTNDLVEKFIAFTFKKVILSSISKDKPITQYNSTLSELDRQRLRLFSDNKFDVIEAHKEILRIEKESNTKETNTINSYINELKNAKEEIEELKNKIGRGNEWCSVSFKKREWRKKYGHSPDWKVLCEISNSLNIKPIKDCIEKDRKGIERKVNRYHNSVWAEYEKREEMLINKKNDTQTKYLPFIKD